MFLSYIIHYNLVVRLLLILIKQYLER